MIPFQPTDQSWDACVRDDQRRIGYGSTNWRGGFTLIELLMVLSLIASILGGTISLMTLVRGSDQQSQQNLLRRSEVRRFADDVRRDVHAADEINIEKKELVLKSAGSDSLIRYRTGSRATIERETMSADQSVIARDQYALADDADIRIESSEQDRSVRITIDELNSNARTIEIIAIGPAKENRNDDENQSVNEVEIN